MAVTTQIIVFESHGNKIERIVTQIMLLQQPYLLFPNYVTANKRDVLLQKLCGRNKPTYCSRNFYATKQVGLLLHKLLGRKNRTYCSPATWPQKKRDYCY